jgi:hypothetical protein
MPYNTDGGGTVEFENEVRVKISISHGLGGLGSAVLAVPGSPLVVRRYNHGIQVGVQILNTVDNAITGDAVHRPINSSAIARS